MLGLEVLLYLHYLHSIQSGLLNKNIKSMVEAWFIKNAFNKNKKTNY